MTPDQLEVLHDWHLAAEDQQAWEFLCRWWWTAPVIIGIVWCVSCIQDWRRQR